MSAQDNEELIDYEDEQEVIANGVPVSASNGALATHGGDDKEKKNFSGIHSTGFRYVVVSIKDLLLVAYALCFSGISC